MVAVQGPGEGGNTPLSLQDDGGSALERGYVVPKADEKLLAVPPVLETNGSK